MSLRSFVCSAVVVSAAASAQTPGPVGPCEGPGTWAVLETPWIQVPVSTSGQLFFGYNGGNQYLVPKAEGVSPVYAGSLWVSGYVDDSLRAAAGTWSSREFWPGPLPEADAPPPDCSAFDRIWLVRRADVERYYATGEATADLAEWPYRLGAPVIDGDGDPTNYDLAGGDQPDLLGDVAAWWVMNDAGGPHTRTLTGPVGVEVRAHVFAYEAVQDPIRYASFYRYEVINRRDVPVDSLRISLWTDVDLGAAHDDYVGTDTLQHLAYVYNADNDDDAPLGYGEAPPAWGVQILKGIPGLPNGRDDDFDGEVDEASEEMRMTTAPIAPKNSPPPGFGDPRYGWQVVNVQRGLFDGGTPIHAYGSGRTCAGGGGGCGPDSTPLGEPTVFAFPADPASGEYWTEVNSDGEGHGNPYGDRRMVITTGPGRLGPGESVTVDLAMPYARGGSHLESVIALRRVARVFQSVFGGGAFPSRPVEHSALPPRSLGVSRVRPNPSAAGAVAVLSLPEAGAVEAVVVDALGRRVAVVVDGEVPAGDTTLAIPDGLPPGAYVLRVSASWGAPVVLPFTVVR